jgi:hypothetical protein
MKGFVFTRGETMRLPVNKLGMNPDVRRTSLGGLSKSGIILNLKWRVHTLRSAIELGD